MSHAYNAYDLIFILREHITTRTFSKKLWVLNETKCFLEIFLNFFGTPVMLIMKLTILYGTSWDIQELKGTGFYACLSLSYSRQCCSESNRSVSYLLVLPFTAVKICEIEAIFLEPHTCLLATKVRCSSIYGIISFIYVTIALVSEGFPRKD